jgi:hypothetical protein
VPAFQKTSAKARSGHKVFRQGKRKAVQRNEAESETDGADEPRRQCLYIKGELEVKAEANLDWLAEERIVAAEDEIGQTDIKTKRTNRQ